MSSMAKTAREAMKAKAKRLGSSRPTEKVDSSTFTPPELLNADVKTGLRPVSRRAFKKGGKVTGKANEARADRKPRKAGGKTEATEFANAKVNRNVKAANEEREGKKHIGGMARGGRNVGQAANKIIKLAKMYGEDHPSVKAARDEFNALAAQREANRPMSQEGQIWKGVLAKGQDKSDGMKKGGKVARKGRDEGGKVDEIADLIRRNPVPEERVPLPMPRPKNLDKAPPPPNYRKDTDLSSPYKSGGRTAKAMGGPQVGASKMMRDASETAGVPSSTMQFSPVKNGKFANSVGMKKGGKAHEDVAADKALIKKMVKPSARTGKDVGGGLSFLSPLAMGINALRGNKNSGGRAGKDDGGSLKLPSDAEMQKKAWADRKAQRKEAGDKTKKPVFAKGGEARTARKTGGGVFTGPSYPGKIPGVVPGGRTARATGGKTKGKGKTNINIVIAAGKTPGADAGLMPPGGMPKPPGGIPIPLGPQGGPPQGGAPMPMPMPMPMPPQGGAGGPPSMPPMGRKAGGRISKVASSYKDMEAGSAGGEGRLQKTDIAKKHKGAPTFKKGGKVYRSYKDMDAGAASGLGRLEKSEIAARKG